MAMGVWSLRELNESHRALGTKSHIAYSVGTDTATWDHYTHNSVVFSRYTKLDVPVTDAERLLHCAPVNQCYCLSATYIPYRSGPWGFMFVVVLACKP